MTVLLYVIMVYLGLVLSNTITTASLSARYAVKNKCKYVYKDK